MSAELVLESPAKPQLDAGWTIQPIVSQLRVLRDASLAARRRSGRPVKLPSRTALLNVVEGLTAALFPNRLSPRDLADESVDFFVGRTLDTALCELERQVMRELQIGVPPEKETLAVRASRLIQRFAEGLPEIRGLLETDLQAAYDVDSAAGSVDEVLACRPGVSAIAHHRLAHSLFGLGAPVTARILAEIAHASTGIAIHPAAEIGGGFCIDHGTGVVIGPAVTIGCGVLLHHGVTLDARHVARPVLGRDPRDSTRGPVIEDQVVIYAGAVILGNITVGRSSVVGGNVWLTHSVPAETMVTQAVARSAECIGGAGI